MGNVPRPRRLPGTCLSQEFRLTGLAREGEKDCVSGALHFKDSAQKSLCKRASGLSHGVFVSAIFVSSPHFDPLSAASLRKGAEVSQLLTVGSVCLPGRVAWPPPLTQVL